MYQKALLGLCNEFIEAAENPPDWVPKVPTLHTLNKKRPGQGVDDTFAAFTSNQEATTVSAKRGELPAMSLNMEQFQPSKPQSPRPTRQTTLTPGPSSASLPKI